jgi:PST family polysaccharide transporter
VTWSFGNHWLLPNGHTTRFTKVTLSAAVLNLGLAIVLAPRFQHIGMAWVVIFSEAFVAVSVLLLYRKIRREPRKEGA